MTKNNQIVQVHSNSTATQPAGGEPIPPSPIRTAPPLLINLYTLIVGIFTSINLMVLFFGKSIAALFNQFGPNFQTVALFLIGPVMVFVISEITRFAVSLYSRNKLEHLPVNLATRLSLAASALSITAQVSLDAAGLYLNLSRKFGSLPVPVLLIIVLVSCLVTLLCIALKAVNTWANLSNEEDARQHTEKVIKFRQEAAEHERRTKQNDLQAELENVDAELLSINALEKKVAEMWQNDPLLREAARHVREFEAEQKRYEKLIGARDEAANQVTNLRLEIENLRKSCPVEEMLLQEDRTIRGELESLTQELERLLAGRPPTLDLSSAPSA